uniref:dolichyl-P-Man:Man5GlcNAc2-PP-dolichol alpha-1,3-mannosyltransferase n=1 Tax=Lygus hesperus TaxID=30085 RepID=A0A0A9Z1J0_LYGHE
MGKNKNRKPRQGWSSTVVQRWAQFQSKYCKLDFLKDLALTTKYLSLVGWLLILAEAIVCVLVVQKVKYTEIDWVAYMQEVEGFLNGTHDYSQLRGDTGPLVYPAGFVYIYSALYYITDRGSDIRLAQYIFVGLYLLLLALVFRLYVRTKKVPAYVLVLMSCTTYRIHSIFILRLFNDPIAMILFYAALNLFLDDRWSLGSIMYSLAVSVKMNILLFSPALFLAYLCCLGVQKTVTQLLICAIVQLLLGTPFLLTNPIAYVKGSFDLGRIFHHRWTVNWRFLPEDLFINPMFHGALLAFHICLLCAFAPIFLTYLKSYTNLKKIESDLKLQSKKKAIPLDMGASPSCWCSPCL